MHKGLIVGILILSMIVLGCAQGEPVVTEPEADAAKTKSPVKVVDPIDKPVQEYYEYQFVINWTSGEILNVYEFPSQQKRIQEQDPIEHAEKPFWITIKSGEEIHRHPFQTNETIISENFLDDGKIELVDITSVQEDIITVSTFFENKIKALGLQVADSQEKVFVSTVFDIHHADEKRTLTMTEKEMHGKAHTVSTRVSALFDTTSRSLHGSSNTCGDLIEIFPGHNDLQDRRRINIIFVGAGSRRNAQGKVDFAEHLVRILDYYGEGNKRLGRRNITIPVTSPGAPNTTLIYVDDETPGMFGIPPFEGNQHHFNFWYSNALLRRADFKRELPEICADLGSPYETTCDQPLPNDQIMYLLRNEFIFNAAANRSSFVPFNCTPSAKGRKTWVPYSRANIRFAFTGLKATMIHEFGHSIGKLADEYVVTDPSKKLFGKSQEGPNCKSISINEARSRGWPDPRGGCSYVQRNTRPTNDSIMRRSFNLSFGVFNTPLVCTELNRVTRKEVCGVCGSCSVTSERVYECGLDRECPSEVCALPQHSGRNIRHCLPSHLPALSFCEQDRQCQSGMCDMMANRSVCLPVDLTNGQECIHSRQCRNRSGCVNGMCQTLLSDGSSCTSSGECASRICHNPGGVGGSICLQRDLAGREFCHVDAQCVSRNCTADPFDHLGGSRCLAQDLPFGFNCTHDIECASGACFNPGTSQTTCLQGDLGGREFCIRDGQCVSNGCFTDPYDPLQRRRCLANGLQFGQNCTYDEECVTDYCRPPPHGINQSVCFNKNLGRNFPCFYDSQCSSGNCSNYVCM